MTNNRKKGKNLFKTFVEIKDEEFQEPVKTSLYPSEIEYIKEVKGWNFGDLIRDGVRYRLQIEHKIQELETRIILLEDKNKKQ